MTSDLILNLTLAAWAPKGIGPYIRQHFLDTTFRGLYHANAFDVALLIPYFVVLILLAGYGMHRYVLVYLYYKHRKNRTTDPAAKFADLPRVTVQLPISTSNMSSSGCWSRSASSNIRGRNSTFRCSTIRPTRRSK